MPAKSIPNDNDGATSSVTASNASAVLEIVSCLRVELELFLARGLYKLRSGL
jgi:hypothetical protein